MKHKTFPLFSLIVPFLIGLGASSQLLADEIPKEYEVDTRGPVHEAFAQPHSANPMPNPVIDRKPPDPIPEEPADERPMGKNVQWIPGYWQWDDDRTDFIWVSGFWRDVPQGRRWVMGYWAETPAGNRWVNGHWAADQERDYQYVPEPPQNPDTGPPPEQREADSYYIPGNYMYGSDGYYYRDGYWSSCMPGQVWIPARYNWSPYGYYYCSGYWDYSIYDRGCLFSPVYFNQPYWNRRGWIYRPLYSIALRSLFNSLFVGYGRNQYFFGDYYARSYLNRGMYPWFWYSGSRFDPLWGYERWANRTNVQWAATQRATYMARINGTQPLPPRTLAAQNQALLAARANKLGPNASAIARAATMASARPQMVNTLAEARQSGMKLEKLTTTQREAQLQTARKLVTQAQQVSRAAPRTADAIPPARRASVSLQADAKIRLDANRSPSNARGTATNRPQPDRSPNVPRSSAPASPVPDRTATPSNRPVPDRTPSAPKVTSPRVDPQRTAPPAQVKPSVSPSQPRSAPPVQSKPSAPSRSAPPAQVVPFSPPSQPRSTPQVQVKPSAPPAQPRSAPPVQVRPSAPSSPRSAPPAQFRPSSPPPAAPRVRAPSRPSSSPPSGSRPSSPPRGNNSGGGHRPKK